MAYIDLRRFRNPALQFSGGKDSLACLFLLREQLDNVTVYWMNAGDTPPETKAVVDAVRQWVPRFVEVTSDVKNWRETNGYPTDLLPANSHFIGVQHGLGGVQLTNRFDCCYHNLMAPLHQRMVDDGVDAVIRGTKSCDGGRVPVEGPTPFYEVILPIKTWSHQVVFDFLESVGAPKNSIYDHHYKISAPECMGCTAWWGEGKPEYLRAKHPELLEPYRQHLRVIKLTLQSHLDDLETEIRS